MTQRIDDIVIAGAGIVGRALAVALARSRGGPDGIRLLDPGTSRPVGEGRGFAIAAGPRRFLEDIGVWSVVAASAQPVRAMAITDSRLRDPVRPVLLDIDGEAAPGEPLAHILEEHRLQEALRDAVRAAALVEEPVAIEDFAASTASLNFRTSDSASGRTRLLVAADGARSPCRAAAGIGVVGRDYAQHGIVATVTHERDHEGRAVQHFLPSGPFAMLPLVGRRSSIVWTAASADVRDLIELPADDFRDEVERRFGRTLGTLTSISRPHAWPLRVQIARSFVGSRIALVGDAAHVVHPIAGQGLNLGLADVASLARDLDESARLGLDPGDADVLERWQRRRRPAAVAMAATTDGLLRLFSNDVTPLRLARDLGLSLVDRLGMDRLLVAAAAGRDSSRGPGFSPRKPFRAE